MKKLILSIIFISFTFASNADELLQNVSGKISEFAAGLIPGEGHTEVGIDLREGYSPNFSILGVREVAPIDDGTIFTQFSIINTESGTGNNADERYIGNIGLGTRKLTNDNTLMIGINNFYDYDPDTKHFRTSLGFEARSAVLEFNYNIYEALGDDYNEENVLDGSELQLSSQIPHLHWATAYINSYKWDGVTRDDIKGKKIGTEMQLTPNFNFELAFDDKDKAGLEDEWYSKLQFVHPGTEGPTALDGKSDTPWKENKDMSGELLSKVKRSNKIMIEFKSSATVSRTD